jgi:hypothetical protein
MVRDVVVDGLAVGPRLTHQRDSARRRHLIELLLIQRKGMSELSHDGIVCLDWHCDITTMMLRREGRIEKMLAT